MTRKGIAGCEVIKTRISNAKSILLKGSGPKGHESVGRVHLATALSLVVGGSGCHAPDR
jgi:hypothetical protein